MEGKGENMWFHKKAEMPYKEGFTQAVGVVAYAALFTLFVTNGERMMPDINETFAPLMFLTLFCFSVLACGLIVFYKPYMLFVDKKGKEAMMLVLATTKWLGVLAVLIVAFVIMMSR